MFNEYQKYNQKLRMKQESLSVTVSVCFSEHNHIAISVNQNFIVPVGYISLLLLIFEHTACEIFLSVTCQYIFMAKNYYF